MIANDAKTEYCSKCKSVIAEPTETTRIVKSKKIMSNNYKNAKRILSHLITKVENKLENNPFIFVNEHDLSAYLFSQLLEIQELKLPFKMERNGIEHYCSRVHLEYPRYAIDLGKLKSVGRYDIAVLRQDSSVEEPFKRDEFTEKPVWMGFEVKLHWNYGLEAIINGVLLEKMAFAKRDRDIERRPADYGVVFHLNIDKKKKTDPSALIEKIKEFQSLTEIKDSKIFVVYIESCGRTEKPSTIVLDPEGKEFR